MNNYENSEIKTEKNLTLLERKELKILERLRTERDNLETKNMHVFGCRSISDFVENKSYLDLEEENQDEHVFGYYYAPDFVEEMSCSDIEEFMQHSNTTSWRPAKHQLWSEFCDFAEEESLDVEKCYKALIKGVRDLYKRI